MIRVVCTCGRAFKAEERHAGETDELSRVRCQLDDRAGADGRLGRHR